MPNITYSCIIQCVRSSVFLRFVLFWIVIGFWQGTILELHWRVFMKKILYLNKFMQTHIPGNKCATRLKQFWFLDHVLSTEQSLNHTTLFSLRVWLSIECWQLGCLSLDVFESVTTHSYTAPIVTEDHLASVLLFLKLY